MKAKRWQLWLITMFILTGIIGVFQLFEGPKSAGAVTVAGGAVNPSVGLPDRSMEATELPAWVPSASASQTDEARSASSQKPVVVTVPERTTPAATHSAPVSTQVSTQSATQAPSTKSPVISAKSVSTSAAASSTQPKVTTSAPKVTTTAPQVATTTAKATTTAPQPSQSVLKPTASATPTKTAIRPRCYRFLFFWLCR